jgi:hypothetical protein
MSGVQTFRSTRISEVCAVVPRFSALLLSIGEKVVVVVVGVIRLHGRDLSGLSSALRWLAFLSTSPENKRKCLSIQ